MMFIALVLIFVGLMLSQHSSSNGEDATAKGSDCIWFLVGFNIMLIGVLMLGSWA